MITLNVSRQVASLCVAAALLTGCGGSRGDNGAPGAGAAMPGVALATPALGGAFSGSYSGTTSGTACSGSTRGTFFFNGSGNSSFLDHSKESGLLQATRSCAWSGGAILQSSSHPKEEIFMELYEDRALEPSPCDVTFTYSVRGGTGKFASAKGSGSLTFQCSGKTYSDQWSGTLDY